MIQREPKKRTEAYWIGYTPRIRRSQIIGGKKVGEKINESEIL